MMRPGWPEDGTPSLESLRELRLRALLNDLVKDLGQARAAEELGIDRKTLWRSEGAGRMSERLVGALERMLLQRAVAAMEEDRETIRALEERVAELEGQLATALEAGGNSSGDGSGGDGGDVDGVVADALWKVFAQEIQRLERRLDTRGAAAPDAGLGSSRTGRSASQGRYPDLVTREPGDGDEQVYGPAWPLINAWRTLWVGHSPLGKGLAWASRRERILELAVAMLEEHGLTLPPETAPLRGLDRGEQLNWRVRELAGVRRKWARLELLRWARRALTLGLWRRCSHGRLTALPQPDLFRDARAKYHRDMITRYILVAAAASVIGRQPLPGLVG